MIDADVELIRARVGDRCRREDRRVRDIRIRDHRDDGRADRIPALARDHPLALRVAAELGPPAGKRIDDHGAEQPGLLRGGRHLPDARHAFEIAQALVVAEPERPVLHQRSADRGAELVAFPLRLRRSERVREEVVGVETVVAEELVDAAANGVGARLDRRVDDGARAAAELGGVGVRLNLELLQRLDRRLHQLHVLAAERVRVGDVVDAVEQEHVVERAIAVHVQHALEVDARQPGSTGKHTGRQQRQLVVVPAVERQFDDLLLIDDRASRRGQRVEQRRRADDLDGLGEPAGLQRDIDARHLCDLQRQARAHRLLEPLALHRHRVVAGSKAGNDVGPGVGRCRSHGDAGLHVRHDHDGVRDHCAGRVGDGARDSRRFLLRERRSRKGAQHIQPAHCQSECRLTMSALPRRVDQPVAGILTGACDVRATARGPAGGVSVGQTIACPCRTPRSNARPVGGGKQQLHRRKSEVHARVMDCHGSVQLGCCQGNKN